MAYTKCDTSLLQKYLVAGNTDVKLAFVSTSTSFSFLDETLLSKTCVQNAKQN